MGGEREEGRGRQGEGKEERGGRRKKEEIYDSGGQPRYVILQRQITKGMGGGRKHIITRFNVTL